MKIVMATLIITTHSSTHPLVKALRTEGEDVLLANGVHSALRLFELNRCRGYYGDLKTDLKNPIALCRFSRALRSRKVPYIYWNRDAPWNEGMKLHRIALLRALKPVDIYLAHSAQKANRYAKQCFYFPNAADDFYYENVDLDLLRNEDAYTFDVSFIGAISNSEWRSCRQRLDFMAALHNKIKKAIPDIKFNIVDTCSKKILISDQIKIIRSSKINLNFGAICDMPGNPSWGLPERVFGIPAAGGFLLTDFRKMIANTFQNNQVDVFYDLNQCAEMIVYYLSNFNHLRDRAESLHHHVIQFHTYSERAKTLLHQLSSYEHP